MKIAGMSKKRLARTVKRVFGEGTPWDVQEKFCFVHLDDSTPSERAARIAQFDPELFFDPECLHCRPFLDEGAIMVYSDRELIGMREVKKGVFETVMLTGERANAAAN